MKTQEKIKAIAKVLPYKLLYNEEQVASELIKQGLNTIKGFTGAYLLYRHIGICFAKGEKYISAMVWKDCGYSLEKIKITEISIGEFYLKRKVLFQQFLTGGVSYEIILNTTIINIKQ